MLPQHVEAVVCFQRLRGQWRVSYGFDGLPIYDGLDLNAAAAMMGILQIKNRAEMLDKLLIMEQAALPIIRDGIAAHRKQAAVHRTPPRQRMR